VDNRVLWCGLFLAWVG